jgi:putative hydrolase of the HAD superfamily
MLVVFDLDDCLYLERDFVLSGFEALERSFELDGFRETAWALFERGVRGDIFDRALLALGWPADSALVQNMVRGYRSHAPRIALAPDARECLRVLACRHDLALITDGASRAQWGKIGALELERWFSPIVVTSDLDPPAPKPAPTAYELVMGDRDGSSCIYVGDNPRKDFISPRALGWRTVRIRRPGGLWYDEPDSPEAPAEVCLPDLGVLDAVLSRMSASPHALETDHSS